MFANLYVVLLLLLLLIVSLHSGCCCCSQLYISWSEWTESIGQVSLYSRGHDMAEQGGEHEEEEEPLDITVYPVSEIIRSENTYKKTGQNMATENRQAK